MRLFVAADLSPSQLEKLSRFVELAKSTCHFPFVRWLPPENWHGTLAFLGDRATDDMVGIEQVVESALLAATDLWVVPTRIQAFPNRENPKMLALKAEPSGALKRLHFRLRNLTPNDLRPLKYHVSVARFGVVPETMRADFLGTLKLFPALSEQWRIPSITLFESNLTPTGAIYRPVRTWQCG